MRDVRSYRHPNYKTGEAKLPTESLANRKVDKKTGERIRGPGKKGADDRVTDETYSCLTKVPRKRTNKDSNEWEDQVPGRLFCAFRIKNP